MTRSPEDTVPPQDVAALPPLLERAALLLESWQAWAPGDDAVGEAEQLLARGPQPAPGVAPLGRAAGQLDGLSWLCLREAAAGHDPRVTAARASAAWTALAAAGRPAALVLGADGDGRAGLAVGLSGGAEGAPVRQWLSDAAPDLIWAPGVPPGWATVADPGHVEEALTCRPGPGPASEGAGPVAGRGGAGAGRSSAGDGDLPGLTQLLSLPTADWCLVLLLEPLPAAGLAAARDRLVQLRVRATRNLTTSEGVRDHVQRSVTDPRAESLVASLGAWSALVDDCLQGGGWRVSGWVGARSASASAVVKAAFARSLQSGSAAVPEGRTQHWDAAPAVAGSPPGYGWLSSRDLAALLVPPPDAVGDLQIRLPLPAGRRSKPVTRPITLGRWLGTDLPAVLDVDDLAGHAFVAGITGSGKSTTTSSLLVQLWNRHRVPFLVIDPAKADYEKVSQALDGGLTVVSGAELRMNALAPWPGRPAARHIALVATAFRAAFGLPVPVPYVASLILEELAADAEAGIDVSLHDAAARLDSLVAELGYQGEIEGNIRASLGLRLRLLLQPGRAERVAGTGAPVWLTERPTLIQLSDLGDEEERAFLASLLVLWIADAARARGESPSVRHVTVVEEAHRLMPEPRSSSSEEGDAASVASRLMTQLLAEVRAYGESLMVVDQSPAAVAREVLRNTNLKLAHRIVDTDDQRSLGGALGLAEDETPMLGSLTVGRCLMSSRDLIRPQSVQVTAPELPPAARGAGGLFGPALPELPPRRCHRTEDARHHHASESHGARAELAVALWVADPDGPDVIEELRPVLAGSPLVRTACLVDVGIRRHVRTLRRIGHLRDADAGGYADRLWAAMLGRGELPEHPGARTPRPFSSCAKCQAVCTARSVVSSGALPQLGRARAAVARATGTKASVEAIAVAMESCRSELAASRPAPVARAVGYCIGAHVSNEFGYEAALLAFMNK